MCAALKVLGLTSYHWDEVLSNKNNGHLQLWLEAMHAKYDGKGKPFAGQDFDHMLWNYDVGARSLALSSNSLTNGSCQSISDEPCCYFVEELIAAYPDAKVVLNTRTRESWLRSMQNSILKVLSWRSFTILSYVDHDFTAGYWPLLNRTTSVLSRGIPAYTAAAYPDLLESFDRHYDHVRSVVPKERLLEFHPSQGWGPLCDFLSIPMPEEEFPHLNEPSTLVEIRKRMYWSRWYHVAQGLAKRVGIVGLVVLATMWIGGYGR